MTLPMEAWTFQVALLLLVIGLGAGVLLAVTALVELAWHVSRASEWWD